MKLLILVNNYPGEKPSYAERFVHARVEEYNKSHQCLVASFKVPADYVFEGVPVVRLLDEDHFYAILDKYLPDRILVHFALKRIIQLLKPVNIKTIVWVHGYEALGWYRRWFEWKGGDIFSRGFLRKLLSNLSQQTSLRKFIQRSNRTQSIVFVFVSDWMWRVTLPIPSAGSYTKILSQTLLMIIVSDTIQSRMINGRILVIRPFTSAKYALDLVRDTILGLAKEPGFEKLNFTIYGQGPSWEEITTPLKPLNNIHLHNHLLDKSSMAEVFSKHGILLCPSRQDAQGVTMCEAMSCGLVPVTSNNTGIPEFVEDGYSGYTTASVREMILRIQQLVARPDLFNILSRQAALSIRKKAGIDEVIRKELSVILS